MELDLKKMTDRELLLILATHVVEKQPEVKRKLLTESLVQKLLDSAWIKMSGQSQLEEYVTYGWKLTATIDYNDEKICTSSDYTDGDPLLGRQVGFVEEFGKRFASVSRALAEKIASTYDLERVGDVDAQIQLKLRRIDVP